MLKPLRSRGRGFALLEALVAMAVLALGVLAILGAQLRSLAQAQAAMHRAQAVRLVDDLGERLRAHPDAHDQWAVYRLDWDARPSAPDCGASACDAVALARRDVALWAQAVTETLPLGRASLFDAGGRRLGVMLAWGARPGRRDALELSPVDANPPFEASEGAQPQPGAPRCPEGLVCHLGHVHL